MIQLDQTADTFPVGMAGTPFEEVYRALRIVAASVWAVDPTVYRAGMSWGWYALHAPEILAGFRDVVTAALVSAVAPMVSDTQTDSELVEYLRQWRCYTPTGPKLEAILALFGIDAEVRAISDPEGQSLLPVQDTRLAFYIFVRDMDWARPMWLGDIAELARRATPLGARPFLVYLVEGSISVPVAPAPTGGFLWVDVWESAVEPIPPAPVLPYEFVLVDSTTGRVVHGVEQLNEMVFAPTGFFTIEDTGDIVFVEQSPYPIVSRFHVDFDTVQTIADGAYIDTVLPYYTSKLYIAGIVDRVSETVVDFGLTVSNEGGYVRVTNNTGASVTLTRLAIQSMDATDAEVVEVVDGQDNHAYAFKWDDGTPYWWISYSGERHWTDTLGNWSEVPPVVLPTVTRQWLYAANNVTTIDLYSGQTSGKVYELVGSSYVAKQYNSSVLQCIFGWRGTSSSNYGFCTFETIIDNGYIYAKNITATRIAGIYLFRYAECDDLSATVVPVYDSSNVAYNAFKFTVSGTDYYYVLDGTQTDWTDDLASIGYHLQESMEIFFYLAGDHAPAQFTANDYWGSVIIDSADKVALRSFGVSVTTISGKDVVERGQSGSFDFTPIGLYSGVRTGDNGAQMSNFSCSDGPNNPASVYYGLCIYSVNAYSTSSVTWKCRITKL